MNDVPARPRPVRTFLRAFLLGLCAVGVLSALAFWALR